LNWAASRYVQFLSKRSTEQFSFNYILVVWVKLTGVAPFLVILQKRNRKGTIRLIIVPIYLCLIISVLQRVINNFLDKPKYRCGCKCIDVNGTGPCQNVCGIQYSTLDQAPSCPIPNPPKWPALVQVPLPEYRAVQDSSGLFTGFPDESCRKTQTCAVSIPFAGTNRTLSNSKQFVPSSFIPQIQLIQDS
jgi:hypothetical protein